MGVAAGFAFAVRYDRMEFDVKLFHGLVDYATVYHDGKIVFKFRNGTEIETII